MGVDAAATAMAESSLRAARPARKGGLPNAIFILAAAERPPAELSGIPAEVTIAMPWGSLLRGALALDGACAAADGIAALVAPGGIVRVLLSIDPRDRLSLPAPENVDAVDLASRWRRHGLALTAFRPAEAAEIAAGGSSWSRRLAAGRDRTVWRIELRRGSRRPRRPPASGLAIRR
jgi:16S rRNA (adenine(1408)-N(1))-methyltransferase